MAHRDVVATLPLVRQGRDLTLVRHHVQTLHMRLEERQQLLGGFPVFVGLCQLRLQIKRDGR